MVSRRRAALALSLMTSAGCKKEAAPVAPVVDAAAVAENAADAAPAAGGGLRLGSHHL